jgi:hypothetical protein
MMGPERWNICSLDPPLAARPAACTCCCPRPARCAAGAARRGLRALPGSFLLASHKSLRTLRQPCPNTANVPPRLVNPRPGSKRRQPPAPPAKPTRPSYDATITAADYAPPLDHLVLQLKFSARLPLAPWFARMLRDAVLASPACPCPTCCARCRWGPPLVERGFNQALEIARPLARAGRGPAPALAVRASWTPGPVRRLAARPRGKHPRRLRHRRIRAWWKGATSASSTTS